MAGTRVPPEQSAAPSNWCVLARRPGANAAEGDQDCRGLGRGVAGARAGSDRNRACSENGMTDAVPTCDVHLQGFTRVVLTPSYRKDVGSAHLENACGVSLLSTARAAG